jgi:hypothetical protein
MSIFKGLGHQKESTAVIHNGSELSSLIGGNVFIWLLLLPPNTNKSYSTSIPVEVSSLSTGDQRLNLSLYISKEIFEAYPNEIVRKKEYVYNLDVDAVIESYRASIGEPQLPGLGITFRFRIGELLRGDHIWDILVAEKTMVHVRDKSHSPLRYIIPHASNETDELTYEDLWDLIVKETEFSNADNGLGRTLCASPSLSRNIHVPMARLPEQYIRNVEAQGVARSHQRATLGPAAEPILNAEHSIPGLSQSPWNNRVRSPGRQTTNGFDFNQAPFDGEASTFQRYSIPVYGSQRPPQQTTFIPPYQNHSSTSTGTPPRIPALDPRLSARYAAGTEALRSQPYRSPGFALKGPDSNTMPQSLSQSQPGLSFQQIQSHTYTDPGFGASRQPPLEHTMPGSNYDVRSTAIDRIPRRMDGTNHGNYFQQPQNISISASQIENLPRANESSDSFFASNGTAPRDNQKEALEKLFEKYRSQSHHYARLNIPLNFYIDSKTDEVDLVNVDGTMTYLSALGVNLESAEMLIPLEIIKAPAFGEIEKEPFVNGWRAVG